MLTEAEGQLRAEADSRGATDISPSDAEYRTIDHDYPLAIATLVRNAGAASFALTSSAGADARSRFAYTRLKGELEDAIEHLGFPSLTVARPGFLGGARSEPPPDQPAQERRWNPGGIAVESSRAQS